MTVEQFKPNLTLTVIPFRLTKHLRTPSETLVYLFCCKFPAICDLHKRFLDVTTGHPSKVHDARAYGTFSIADKLPEICRRSQYHILGDAARRILERSSEIRRRPGKVSDVRGGAAVVYGLENPTGFESSEGRRRAALSCGPAVLRYGSVKRLPF
ncbi:hypothetical protein HPB47_015428 [Ixodes persulcatus]|uniref:Uncharacterized protein n=1 Tax=Ixodes persulcatus TaxID=34615 RepID=A0AC60QVH7_IXOPE|nr:hypothetical protein HPB47_015428 [Ixodes persulcatus]